MHLHCKTRAGKRGLRSATSESERAEWHHGDPRCIARFRTSISHEDATHPTKANYSSFKPTMQDVSSHGLSEAQKAVNDKAREQSWALLSKHIQPLL